MVMLNCEQNGAQRMSPLLILRLSNGAEVVVSWHEAVSLAENPITGKTIESAQYL
jgi:hypothetical protein